MSKLRLKREIDLDAVVVRPVRVVQRERHVALELGVLRNRESCAEPCGIQVLIVVITRRKIVESRVAPVEEAEELEPVERLLVRAVAE